MSDISWEQRMAERATRRIEMLGGSGPCGTLGHHTHLEGTAVKCSCGWWDGSVVCVVIDPDAPPPVCDVCGKVGAVSLKR